jgi:hypothetical protein
VVQFQIELTSNQFYKTTLNKAIEFNITDKDAPLGHPYKYTVHHLMKTDQKLNFLGTEISCSYFSLVHQHAMNSTTPSLIRALEGERTGKK